MSADFAKNRAERRARVAAARASADPIAERRAYLVAAKASGERAETISRAEVETIDAAVAALDAGDLSGDLLTRAMTVAADFASRCRVSTRAPGAR